MAVQLIKGSLLDAKVDCIVNPANSFLRHGAGLARIIANGAAPSPATAWWEEQRKHPSIPTGGVGITSAGALPYKGIIHAVGPIWGGGLFYEYELLKLAYWNSIMAMRDSGWTSIAFPAISSGLFGVPIEEVANAAIAGLSECDALESDERVEIYLLDDKHIEAFYAELELYVEP